MVGGFLSIKLFAKGKIFNLIKIGVLVRKICVPVNLQCLYGLKIRSCSFLLLCLAHTRFQDNLLKFTFHTTKCPR